MNLWNHCRMRMINLNKPKCMSLISPSNPHQNHGNIFTTPPFPFVNPLGKHLLRHPWGQSVQKPFAVRKIFEKKTSFEIEKISISKLSECWWPARSTWYASIAFRNIKAWHKGVLLNCWVWVYLRWFIIPHWHWFNIFTKTESKNSNSFSAEAVPWFLRPNLLSALMFVDWKSLVIDEPSTTTNKLYRLETCAKKRNSLDQKQESTSTPDYLEKSIWIWISFWQVIALRYPLRKMWVNLLTFQKLQNAKIMPTIIWANNQLHAFWDRKNRMQKFRLGPHPACPSVKRSGLPETLGVRLTDGGSSCMPQTDVSSLGFFQWTVFFWNNYPFQRLTRNWYSFYPIGSMFSEYLYISLWMWPFFTEIM